MLFTTSLCLSLSRWQGTTPPFLWIMTHQNLPLLTATSWTSKRIYRRSREAAILVSSRKENREGTDGMPFARHSKYLPMSEQKVILIQMRHRRRGGIISGIIPPSRLVTLTAVSHGFQPRWRIGFDNVTKIVWLYLSTCQNEIQEKKSDVSLNTLLLVTLPHTFHYAVASHGYLLGKKRLGFT